MKYNGQLSRIFIETALWGYERHIMQKYGSEQAQQDMAPLRW